MLKKKVAGLALVACMLPLSMSSFASYPDKSIQGTVPWGAGGLTDIVARSLTPHAEKELNTSIVLHNRPGGSTAIGVNYVKTQKADGYNFLLGTQDTTLLSVLDIANLDYKGFTPINIIGQGLSVIAVPSDSKLDTMKKLISAVKDNPNTIRMGDVGPGATPHIAHTIIDSSTDFNFSVRKVTFGGDGPGITALLGKHIDFMPLSLAPAMEQIRSGAIKPLAVLNGERISALPEVPAITESLPNANKFLPWGSFQGVFVREETPDSIKEILTNAFVKAVSSREFSEKYTNQFGGMILNKTGSDAQEYIDRWQSVTSWLLEDTGEAKVSPQSLGIPRP